jgi:hypothetical protein
MSLYFSSFILPIPMWTPLYGEGGRERERERERERHTYPHNHSRAHPLLLFLFYVYTNGSLKETIIFATSGLIRWLAGISPELTIFLILVPLSSSLNSGP